MIPKRFIRVWLGKEKIPTLHEVWWSKFKEIHPHWEFITITDSEADSYLYPEVKYVYEQAPTYSSRSNVIRYCALRKIGGVYIDTDVKPLQSFDILINDPRPFAGKRSEVSFESAVLGCPQEHVASVLLIKNLKRWFEVHRDKKSGYTGPQFLSAMWFGRADVRHLEKETFYPYNGFMAPKRDERLKMFEDDKNFPKGMIAAHFSNQRWGGKPK